MKDYTKTIDDLTLFIIEEKLTIKEALTTLERTIRKDVKAEIERLKAENERLKLENERLIREHKTCLSEYSNNERSLREENESLKSENIRFKKSLMKLQLQAKETPIPVGKSDKERLWDAMMMIASGSLLCTDSPCQWIYQKADSLLNTWKEATK